MEKKHSVMRVLVMFWTILTTLFAWLPLVRIIGRPEGYEWGIMGLSGSGTEGPFWIFILLTLYVLILLYSFHRGPRALFYPMLILWHAVVTVVVAAGTLAGDTVQGQGLHWESPLWLFIIPCLAALIMGILLAVADYRSGRPVPRASWSRGNTARLLASLLLLVVALVLFRAGTNYNWVTSVAIITTIVHWIMLAESFKPLGTATAKAG